MQDPLVEEIPPHKLLLRNIPSDKLKKAVLKANTFNRKYWLEVAHVWMCAYFKNKPGEETRIPELDKEELRLSDTVLNALDKNNEQCVEAFVAEQSYRVIDSYECKVLTPAAEDATTFLNSLLQRISEHCSFEKNNDKYLHALIKTKLPFRKTFILEPPFQAMNHYYHGEANAIIRPLMVRDGKAACDAAVLSVRTPDALASAVALISEALDGKVNQMAVNGEMHRYDIIPFALVGSACRWGDQIGLKVNTTLYITRDNDPFPITTIIFHWAKHFSNHLFQALTTPETLQPGSGLYKFVH